ncbi:MAG: prolipoprotein diacylglyceryl transferase [Flavobacteriales bacterium]|jgi:prolipoprotein diacylglyceryltransferase|nr:prolipoprotein diacylglyceryl transferase [Flavobacteriales bacterium]MBK6894401.1 prolipoprotein diacylglyceryl transferase [Flavobacteriales bacterium]MBK7248331.1 prolipoprotein diacylglyceryl transferase [Flavobacteriales bacterium]MBK9598161.1 prolipoprotein diacylglyceryl transferase [Flavobacteriales bacterium]QQS73585.1 MAG: prolipoprotein diacylglyceryl transferase [Flavobacteriales bacterium]
MYPTLYHALFDLTGLDWPVLKFLNSFGFFVALAFMGAYWTLVQELKRKEGIGLIKATTRTVMVGEGAKPAELAMQGLMGFIVGWKGLYILLNTAEVTADPPGFLLSGTGSFIGGIAVAALFVWLLWREKEKQRLKEPKKETVTIHPAQHGGNITITAALWGFIGAKVFHWIESPRDFLDLINTGNIRDLISGLTMYGGLIVAGIMVIRYFKKNGMAILPSMDAAAPGLMLAYGIGRLGCQVAGDGDWGIANTAPKPGWIPQWLWSYDYPNNVNAVLGAHRGGYVGEHMTSGTIFPGYGTHLVPGVFPTPLYEVIMCLLLFGVLWGIRKRIALPGVLFCIYLIMNGVERFLIEHIRVNNLFIGTWTQAEIISLGLVIIGVGGILWLRKRNSNGQPERAH